MGQNASGCDEVFDIFGNGENWCAVLLSDQNGDSSSRDCDPLLWFSSFLSSLP